MTVRTWRAAFVEEPLHLAAAQPAQLGISALSMLFTAIFFAAPLLDVTWLWRPLVFVVAGAAALGVEYAFLKGISDRAFVEAHGGTGFWGDVLVYTTGALLIVAGCTVLLTYAYKLPGFTAPGPWLAALLALLHIVPLAVIGVCSAQLHAGAEKAQQVTARRLADETKRRAQSIEERKQQIDVEVYEAEQRAMAKLRVRAVFGPNTAQPVQTASGTGTNSVREQIVRTLREQPKANKTKLAAELGIGRTALYDHIKAARAAGDLLPEEA